MTAATIERDIVQEMASEAPVTVERYNDNDDDVGQAILRKYRNNPEIIRAMGHRITDWAIDHGFIQNITANIGYFFEETDNAPPAIFQAMEALLLGATTEWTPRTCATPEQNEVPVKPIAFPPSNPGEGAEAYLLRVFGDDDDALRRLGVAAVEWAIEHDDRQCLANFIEMLLWVERGEQLRMPASRVIEMMLAK